MYGKKLSAKQGNSVICPGGHVGRGGGRHKTQHRCVGVSVWNLWKVSSETSTFCAESRAWPGVFVRRGAGVGHWHGAHFQKTVAFTFLHRKPLFFRNDKPLPFTFL